MKRRFVELSFIAASILAMGCDIVQEEPEQDAPLGTLGTVRQAQLDYTKPYRIVDIRSQSNALVGQVIIAGMHASSPFSSCTEHYYVDGKELKDSTSLALSFRDTDTTPTPASGLGRAFNRALCATWNDEASWTGGSVRWQTVREDVVIETTFSGDVLTEWKWWKEAGYRGEAITPSGRSSEIRSDPSGDWSEGVPVSCGGSC